MPKPRSFLCWIVIWISFIGSPSFSQEPQRILYLHLRRDASGITLIESSIHPGRLKTVPQAGRLEHEMDGAVQGRIVDPLMQRLEYEDPSEPGKLLSKLVQRDSADFTLRLPESAAGRSLKFFQRPSPRVGEVRAQANRTFIGEIMIPKSINRVQALAASAKFSTLVTNGPVSARLNIAVLAEGFTAAEETSFTNRARAVVDRFLSTSPYDQYRNHFNAFAIFVPSAESGSDHPSRNAFRNTYFNSSYDSYGLNRLITIPPNERNSSYNAGQGKVMTLLGQFVPDYDIALLLVNDPEYGGSGGVPAITSIDESSSEIAIHEIGHSFAGLGDEYDSAYPGYPDTEEPNTTRETNRELIKWRDWIQLSTPVPTPETGSYADKVGLFEGAHFHTTDWYRPKLDCKMRALGVEFCEVCQETLVLAAYAKLNVIQGSTPAENNVSVPGGGALILKVNAVDPVDRPLTYTWTVNGVTNDSSSAELFSASFESLGTGSHLVRVQVEDRTALVRIDPFGKLWESRSWLVQVHGPTNQPPVISSIQDRRIIVGNPIEPIPFVVTDLDTPFSSVSVSASSSVPTIIPNSALALIGAGTNRTLTVAFNPTNSGVTVITIEVSDGNSIITEQFDVDVSVPPPSIALTIPDQRVFSGTIDVGIGVSGNGHGPLTFSGTASNFQLIPEANIQFHFENGNYSVSLTPVANGVGSSDVTVTATDGMIVAEETFNVTFLAAPAPLGFISQTASSEIQVRFTTETPATMILEQSSDMRFWTPVGTQPDSTVFEFLVPGGALNVRAFYRVRLVPL